MGLHIFRSYIFNLPLSPKSSGWLAYPHFLSPQQPCDVGPPCQAQCSIHIPHCPSLCGILCYTCTYLPLQIWHLSMACLREKIDFHDLADKILYFVAMRLHYRLHPHISTCFALIFSFTYLSKRLQGDSTLLHLYVHSLPLLNPNAWR